MKDRMFLTLTAVIVLLLIFFLTSFDAQEKAQNVLRFNKIHTKFTTGTAKVVPKCSLSAVCPSDHFAFKIWSGAANVVGPKICFDGKNIMSHIMNNVGPGLNTVVVNGENGVVEKFGYLNMISGNSTDILAYLKEIKPGMIVLVASFDDAATKMTEEIRQMFVEMGSTLIDSVKQRDNWVFAGRTGIKIKSFFEQRAENDKKTNIFDGWPEMVEVGGCFPRTTSV
ncbi:protein FAM3C [Xiphophorus hellerii]|uniref:protein FAM3C n=1 Tax=Xiphophorus hellerii TaxID=8084 RepID=UPI0013B40AEC|nr:protein FAM3C-like [Xiphophorus hellerii]